MPNNYLASGTRTYGFTADIQQHLDAYICTNNVQIIVTCTKLNQK